MIDLKKDSNNLKNEIKKEKKIDFEKEIKLFENHINKEDNSYDKDILELKNNFGEILKLSKEMGLLLDDKQHINEKDNKFIENKIDNKKKIIILLIILYILCCIIYKNRNNIFKNSKLVGGANEIISVKEEILENLPFTGKLMPIFVCCIVILLGILYFKKRKLKIICNCDNGSWWYSCVEGSGYGSPTCNVYHKFMDAIEFLGKKVIYLFNKIVWFRNIIKNAILKSFKIITNATSAVLSKIPTLPNLGKVVDKIFPNLNFSCNINFPIINKSFNPCSGFNAAWNTASKGLKEIFNKISDIFSEIFKQLIKGITKSFDLIKELISSIIKYALYPIFLITKSLKYLMKKFMSLVESILDIGIIKIIVFQVATTIAQITGIKDIGKVLGTAIVSVFTIIFMPIFGGIFIILQFIFGIIISIFSFIFGIIQQLFMFFFML
jgi:hypothetical protein